MTGERPPSPVQAKGYTHPDQSLTVPGVKIADNMEPVIPHPEQNKTARAYMTGQLPLHHGLHYPPMYGQAGSLDGTITIAKLLSDQGYVTHDLGKWHMGKNEGSLPNSVGFDDICGFWSVSDEYTEWRDVNANPEIALNPARFCAFEGAPFSHNEVQCKKGKKTASRLRLAPPMSEAAYNLGILTAPTDPAKALQYLCQTARVQPRNPRYAKAIRQISADSRAEGICAKIPYKQ